MDRIVTQKPPPINSERERRLAETLRDNLRKRKAQARGVKAEIPPKD
jgi:hypothetical protein